MFDKSPLEEGESRLISRVESLRVGQRSVDFRLEIKVTFQTSGPGQDLVDLAPRMSPKRQLCWAGKDRLA